MSFKNAIFDRYVFHMFYGPKNSYGNSFFNEKNE